MKREGRGSVHRSPPSREKDSQWLPVSVRKKAHSAPERSSSTPVSCRPDVDRGWGMTQYSRASRQLAPSSSER